MLKDTMQAIQLTRPCTAAELTPTEVKIPQLKPGYALVKVKAFGVNESEVTSRKGNHHLTSSFPGFLVSRGRRY
ncbi:MAG: hypothetical protein ACLSH6_05750 [Limosilactobacillus pontis]